MNKRKRSDKPTKKPKTVDVRPVRELVNGPVIPEMDGKMEIKLPNMTIDHKAPRLQIRAFTETLLSQHDWIKNWLKDIRVEADQYHGKNFVRIYSSDKTMQLEDGTTKENLSKLARLLGPEGGFLGSPYIFKFYAASGRYVEFHKDNRLWKEFV